MSGQTTKAHSVKSSSVSIQQPHLTPLRRKKSLGHSVTRDVRGRGSDPRRPGLPFRAGSHRKKNSELIRLRRHARDLNEGFVFPRQGGRTEWAWLSSKAGMALLGAFFLGLLVALTVGWWSVAQGQVVLRFWGENETISHMFPNALDSNAHLYTSNYSDIIHVDATFDAELSSLVRIQSRRADVTVIIPESTWTDSHFIDGSLTPPEPYAAPRGAAASVSLVLWTPKKASFAIHEHRGDDITLLDALQSPPVRLFVISDKDATPSLFPVAAAALVASIADTSRSAVHLHGPKTALCAALLRKNKEPHVQSLSVLYSMRDLAEEIQTAAAYSDVRDLLTENKDDSYPILDDTLMPFTYRYPFLYGRYAPPFWTRLGRKLINLSSLGLRFSDVAISSSPNLLQRTLRGTDRRRHDWAVLPELLRKARQGALVAIPDVYDLDGPENTPFGANNILGLLDLQFPDLPHASDRIANVSDPRGYFSAKAHHMTSVSFSHSKLRAKKYLLSEQSQLFGGKGDFSRPWIVCHEPTVKDVWTVLQAIIKGHMGNARLIMISDRPSRGLRNLREDFHNYVTLIEAGSPLVTIVEMASDISYLVLGDRAETAVRALLFGMSLVAPESGRVRDVALPFDAKVRKYKGRKRLFSGHFAGNSYLYSPGSSVDALEKSLIIWNWRMFSKSAGWFDRELFVRRMVSDGLEAGWEGPVRQYDRLYGMHLALESLESDRGPPGEESTEADDEPEKQKTTPPNSCGVGLDEYDDMTEKYDYSSFSDASADLLFVRKVWRNTGFIDYKAKDRARKAKAARKAAAEAAAKAAAKKKIQRKKGIWGFLFFS